MFSPLDQFDLFFIFFFKIYFLDLFLNAHNIFFLFFFIFCFFIFFLLLFKGSFIFYLCFFQLFWEFLYSFVFNSLVQQVGRRGIMFFPLFFSFFLFILFFNFFGLVPYASIITSNFSIGLLLAFLSSCFLLTNTFFEFSFFFLRCYIPDVPFFILLLLLLVEVFSVNIKSLSMAIRLSANITAGHTLVFIISNSIFQR